MIPRSNKEELMKRFIILGIITAAASVVYNIVM